MKSVSRLRVLCSLLLSTALFACANTGSITREPDWSNRERDDSSAPDWYGTPVSWEKLQRIETWLASSGARQWPESIPEAELELAEGRLELARRERATLTAPVLDARLSLAEAGFRRVLDDGRAGSFHRGQAREGLQSIALLRGGAPKASSGSGGLPPIQPRSAWAAAAPAQRLLSPNRRVWTQITVHHSDTESTDVGAIQRIQKMHMEENGWGDIGYHFLIDPQGRIYQGRSLQWQGAHAGGDNNTGNIGICLLGDFEKDRPDPRATRSLQALIEALSVRHGIGRRAVHGHSEFKATACPGRHLMPWVQRYAAG